MGPEGSAVDNSRSAPRTSSIATGKRKAVDCGLPPTRTNLVFHHFTEKDYKRTRLTSQVERTNPGPSRRRNVNHPPTKPHRQQDETNTYNFTFLYPLEVEQEGSASPYALGVVDDSRNDRDYGSLNKGEVKTLVKGQQHNDTVSATNPQLESDPAITLSTQDDDLQEEHEVLAALESPTPVLEEESPNIATGSSQSSLYDLDSGNHTMSVRIPLPDIVNYSTNTQKDDAEEEHAVLAALESPILSSDEETPSMVSRSTQSSIYDMVGSDIQNSDDDHCTSARMGDAQDVYAVVSALRAPSSERDIPSMVSRSSLSSVHDLEEAYGQISALESSIQDRRNPSTTLGSQPSVSVEMSPITEMGFAVANAVTMGAQTEDRRPGDAITPGVLTDDRQQAEASLPHSSVDRARISPGPEFDGQRVPVDIGTVAEILNRVGETQTAVAGIREDIKALRARRDQEQHNTQQVPVTTPHQEEMDADDEGDGPPPPPPRFRRWKVPRKRDAGLNEFHKSIRNCFGDLMGRSSPKVPFNIENLPSGHEVSGYDRTTGDCCDLLDFRPDLRGQIDSDWNQSVINVFVAYYLASDKWCVEHDEDRVASHAEQHLKYLIRRFEKQVSSAEAQRVLDKKRARDERKRQLLLRRIAAARAEKDLTKHIPILVQLGVNGMSSDEESQFHGLRRYRILSKKWRAPHLSNWLRVFDAAYRKARSQPFEPGQGAVPRVRIPAGSQSTPYTARKVVKGLPKNAYDPIFLSSLSTFEYNRLRITKPIEFVHTHAAWSLSQEYGGET